MLEKNYYTEFKKHIDEPLLNYFKYLNENDWEEFFDDYYRHNLLFLLRIFNIPRGERIHTYALSQIKNVSVNIKELISKANNVLFTRYINEKQVQLLGDFFNASNYLKLSIDLNLLLFVINDNSLNNSIRQLAAFTLIEIHENTLNSFWDNLNLEIDKFLIPPYLAFYANKNPITGLKKLSAFKDKPDNLIQYEIPLLYSLHQVSTSISDIEKYKILKKDFPEWMNFYIGELFENYPELNDLKNKIQKPYEDILKKIGLDYAVMDDKRLPSTLQYSLNLLLSKLSNDLNSGDLELLKKINDENLSVIDPVYIYEIKDQLISLKNLVLQTIGISNDPSNEQTYETTENDIYYTVPTLFLYPYFLDKKRIVQREAGVIPYGKQTSVAVVIHKRNKKYSEWQNIRSEIKKDINTHSNEVLDKRVPTSISVNWLKSLIQNLYLKNGVINTVRGYIFQSLIQQFVNTHITDNKKLGEVLKLSTDVNRITEDLPFYRSHSPNDNINENQIFLLDPADAYKISKNGQTRIFEKLNNNYDIINIKHDLDIYVGIGFSLPALPRLLKNNNWKIFQSFIINELKSERDLLENAGISLLNLEAKTIAKLETI